jgi:hypothetical protein
MRKSNGNQELQYTIYNMANNRDIAKKNQKLQKISGSVGPVV